MSGKSLALLTAGAGTVTVSFGGVYLFGGNGTGAEGEGASVASSVAEGGGAASVPSGGGQSAPAGVPGTPEGGTTTGQAQVTTKELKFSSLTEFKNKKGYKCSSLKDVFSDTLDWGNLTSVSEFSKSDPTESDYFGEPTSADDKIKSCLIINWEKTTYTAQQAQDGVDSGGTTGDKWKGIFTWTWSFINDSKGFISVGIATTSAGQLDLTGGAYLLENQNDSNWKIKYKKEIESTDKKAITKSNFDEYFPKIKSDSGVSDGDGDFWGFASGSNDLDNACGGTDACPTNPKDTKIELKELEWTFNKGGNKKIFGWTANWKWWKVMYGTENFDLKARLEKFKGTWSKVGG